MMHTRNGDDFICWSVPFMIGTKELESPHLHHKIKKGVHNKINISFVILSSTCFRCGNHGNLVFLTKNLKSILNFKNDSIH